MVWFWCWCWQREYKNWESGQQPWEKRANRPSGTQRPQQAVIGAGSLWLLACSALANTGGKRGGGGGGSAGGNAPGEGSARARDEMAGQWARQWAVLT